MPVIEKYVCGLCGADLKAVNKELADLKAELEKYRLDANCLKGFVVAHHFRAYENFARILGWSKRQYRYVDEINRIAGQRDVPVYFIRGGPGGDDPRCMEIIQYCLQAGMKVFQIEDDRYLRRHF